METYRDRRQRHERQTDGGRHEVGGLTAGADVALVAVEEAVSDPDVRPRGRVA